MWTVFPYDSTPPQSAHARRCPHSCRLPAPGANLGLRIQTAFKTHLDSLTYGLRGQGWDIGHTDILERLLRPVLDEGGR
ncbi:hypothetical protein ACFFLM_08660 [Deinococcus oregonensis]|uniref:Uncharacterized protein n=1 Tax=Deinococcus oregonensis TaxID=1805970 RepID=A0ABV6AWZ8_9DEIO